MYERRSEHGGHCRRLPLLERTPFCGGTPDFMENSQHQWAAMNEDDSRIFLQGQDRFIKYLWRHS